MQDKLGGAEWVQRRGSQGATRRHRDSTARTQRLIDVCSCIDPVMTHNPAEADTTAAAGAAPSQQAVAAGAAVDAVSSSATAAAPATAAAASSTPSTVSVAPSAPAPVLRSCLSALGPAPVVDSRGGLLSFSLQLQGLTSPLPSALAGQQLAGLEQSVHASLEQLDELSALVEALKHGAGQAGQEVLPELLERQHALQALFRRVHTFAKFAAAQEAQLTQVEQRVASVEAILRRTDAMEVEYARNKASISAAASGAALPLPNASAAAAGGPAAKDSASANASATTITLAKAEKLFSSLMGRISKPTASPPASSSPASAAFPFPSSSSASASSASSASAASSASSGPTMLELMDQWQPFDATMQPVDIDEWFAQA